VVSDILIWFDKNKKLFPWRKNRSPYTVWISEIMLQQTQAKTVEPYFKNWVKKYPNLNSLKRANINQLIKNWEGLGYYSRCQNIFKASRLVKEIPDNFEDLIKLPGIGDYTASAILSIAYNKKYLSLDTNLIRVGARLLGIKNRSTNSIKRIKNFLENHQPEDRPGDYNEAMMDLGREVCKIKNPHCNICPLKQVCKAQLSGNPAAYPQKANPKKLKKVSASVCCFVDKNQKILIQKRENTGLLAGLWEFPGGKIESGETPKEAIIRELEEEIKVKNPPLEFCGKINHVYSSYRATIFVFISKGSHQITIRKNNKKLQWVLRKNIINFAMPKANHKMIKLLDDYLGD